MLVTCPVPETRLSKHVELIIFESTIWDNLMPARHQTDVMRDLVLKLSSRLNCTDDVVCGAEDCHFPMNEILGID